MVKDTRPQQYGESEDKDGDGLEAMPRVGVKHHGSKCKCGSTTHSRTSHRDCPLKRRKVYITPSKDLDVLVSESDDSDTVSKEGVHDDDLSSDSGTEEWFSDDLCICGALNRGHKSHCPLNSRNNSSLSLSLAREKSLRNKSLQSPPPISATFKLGECGKLLKQHIPCRVVGVAGERYQLCSKRSVVSGSHSGKDLTVSSGAHSIQLDKWRQSSKIPLCDVVCDPTCLETCTCALSKCSQPTIVLSDDSDDDTVSNVWVKNQLYTLTHGEREMIRSSDGWLDNGIISAAQLLMLQQFPHVSGLQPPTLAQPMAFQVHRGEFVEILCVRNSHWCTVSNVGCDDSLMAQTVESCP